MMNHDDLGNYSHTEVEALRAEVANDKRRRLGYEQEADRLTLEALKLRAEVAALTKERLDLIGDAAKTASHVIHMRESFDEQLAAAQADAKQADEISHKALDERDHYMRELKAAQDDNARLRDAQWKNIKSAVRTLADWAFGGKDHPIYGTYWVAIVNGLTAKDGPEFTLELDDAGSNFSMYKQQVLNAQADNARLRKYAQRLYARTENTDVQLGLLLASPDDDSALQERLKE